MKLKRYMIEEKKENPDKGNMNKKKIRSTLKVQLQKLDSDIDKIMDNVEKEINKIDENLTFKNKLAQMLVNSEKEAGEFILAIRQLINTLSRDANIIPNVRGHAEGVPRDDNVEVSKGGNIPKIISNKDLDKTVKKI